MVDFSGEMSKVLEELLPRLWRIVNTYASGMDEKVRRTCEQGMQIENNFDRFWTIICFWVVVVQIKFFLAI